MTHVFWLFVESLAWSSIKTLVLMNIGIILAVFVCMMAIVGIGTTWIMKRYV